MWTSRLFWKLVLAYVGWALLLAGAFGICIGIWQREALVSGAQNDLRGTAKAMRNQVAPLIANDDVLALTKLVQEVAADANLRIAIVRDNGTVLVDSWGNAAALTPRQGQPELVAAQSPTGFGFAERLDPQSGIPTLTLAQQVQHAGKSVGFLLLTRELHSVDEQVSSTQRGVWGVALVGIGAILLISYVVVGQIVRPLSRLMEAAEEIGKGNYDYQVRVQNRDELGLLSNAFNHMSRELLLHTDQLRENGERLATVLGSMIEGVIAVNHAEQILFANGAAGTLLEFETEQVVGRPLWETVRNPVVQRAVQEAFIRTEPTRSEFELIRSRRMVAMHATRLPGHPCPGVVLVLHDVTELRRLENLRQEFVANVSHELKTPLTCIKAYAETLLNGALEDPQHNVMFVHRIEEQAERLHQLILDVLSLARIESHPQEIEISAIGLQAAIEDCVEQHSAAAQANNLDLHAELPTEPLWVAAEPEGLQTILDNLVDNALKYTGANGRVTLRARMDGDYAVVEVQDSGIGIAPEHQARIFERFYRADRARSRELGGTGLGLSIVKHLVQAFSGSVGVTSQIGRGSTFSIRLPLATAAQVATVTADQA